MDILEFRDYCLSLSGTEETTPFDETTLVYKVDSKMYVCADMVDFVSVTVKCDPDTAIELREKYKEVSAGYHMNKRHWNTVRTDGDLPDTKIKDWVLDSYNLVKKKDKRRG